MAFGDSVGTDQTAFAQSDLGLRCPYTEFQWIGFNITNSECRRDWPGYLPSAYKSKIKERTTKVAQADLGIRRVLKEQNQWTAKVLVRLCKLIEIAHFACFRSKALFSLDPANNKPVLPSTYRIKADIILKQFLFFFFLKIGIQAAFSFKANWYIFGGGNSVETVFALLLKMGLF